MLHKNEVLAQLALDHQQLEKPWVAQEALAVRHHHGDLLKLDRATHDRDQLSSLVLPWAIA